MPRRQRRDRTHDTRMSFKEMCNRAGISPKERIIMVRTLKSLRGGEQYNH